METNTITKENSMATKKQNKITALSTLSYQINRLEFDAANMTADDFTAAKEAFDALKAKLVKRLSAPVSRAEKKAEAKAAKIAKAEAKKQARAEKAAARLQKKEMKVLERETKKAQKLADKEAAKKTAETTPELAPAA